MKATGRRRRSGAVMVFAVMLLTAGIFVLAAVLQLAATQGISGEAEWAALERRVTLGNSRAMAREYMLSHIFRGSAASGGASGSANFANDFGGFSIEPVPDEDYWTAVSTADPDVVLNINPFNLMERGGFYREVFAGQLEQGDGGVDWSFAVRTRSPVAAGYSFVQQRPGDNDLASLAAPPYIDMNGTTQQFFGFYGMPRTPVSSVTGVWTRTTGDTNGYQGYLDVPPGATVYGVFTDATFYPRDPAGTQLEVRLDLSAADPNVANSVLRYDVLPDGEYDVDGDGDLETRPVTMVVLEGTDQVRKPLHVVVEPGNTTLTGVTLRNDNQRRVYFYRAKTANDGSIFDVASVDAGSWRLGITMSQCNIQFDIGDLEITGGLRTDGNIIFQGGSANFVPETDPGGLDFIADRMMWLEDYRAQQ